MKKTKLIVIIGQLLVLMIFITGGKDKEILIRATPHDPTAISNSAGNEILNEEGNVMGSFAHVKTNDTVRDVVNHPAFKGFGKFILPLDRGTYDKNMQLNRVASLLPYHGHVDPDAVVGTINYMIDKVGGGETIFYDFYTEQQKREDSTKESTGLFFFRGKPGAPFAIVCPGGGFSYVGSVHEGFPHAIELSKKGYNAFVLQYRVGGERTACEDLAAALSYIFRNADMLGVSTKNYSLWGSSAGARMAANIGSYGAAYFGGSDLPKPGTVVMAYTGHSTLSENDPPTFVTSSEDDPIASVSTVERRVNTMRKAGVEVEYRKYQRAGHGFGLGIGTDAEGWIGYAIPFWEKHMSK
ncbi:alpha/beta hydrolase fold [Lucifera butyrica]|uniref:Alpha/beta hydrolase fold n=1 Tax=Lucifera butyrica TaxID=1351585 RepID=A0A498R784_9FIRM|nr:alpha/beta hydrolase [Lucifera butyrica]VBB08616.1 alpha/beta hydrolase fold [Lucifera butyrica]